MGAGGETPRAEAGREREAGLGLVVVDLGVKPGGTKGSPGWGWGGTVLVVQQLLGKGSKSFLKLHATHLSSGRAENFITLFGKLVITMNQSNCQPHRLFRQLN